MLPSYCMRLRALATWLWQLSQQRLCILFPEYFSDVAILDILQFSDVSIFDILYCFPFSGLTIDFAGFTDSTVPSRSTTLGPEEKLFWNMVYNNFDNLDRFNAFKWCLLSPGRVKSPVFCGFSKSHVVLRHKVGTRKVSDHTCKSEMRTNPKKN